MVSITDLKDLSNYDRLCMLEAGMTMVKERPLFGLGPEMVERRYPIYRSPTAPLDSRARRYGCTPCPASPSTGCAPER